MALKISFYFMPKFWLNMVVDDSQVSNVRKLKGKLLLYIYIYILRVHFPSKIHLELVIFSKKKINPEIGKFSYKCAYLE